MALFVAHRAWPPRVTTATVQAYALPLNIVTLAAIGAPTGNPGLLLWGGLALLAGAASAWPFVDRIPLRAARALALGLAALGALLLIIRA